MISAGRVIAQYSVRKQDNVQPQRSHRMHDDPAGSLPGTVEKIIKPIRGEAEKVQIAIQGGDDPNQKIRIANILVDARGEAVSLKTGAVVQIIVKPKPKDQIE
jgi:hypothetical protein